MLHSLLLAYHLPPGITVCLHWLLRGAFFFLLLSTVSLLTARDHYLEAKGRRLVWPTLLVLGLESILLLWT